MVGTARACSSPNCTIFHIMFKKHPQWESLMRETSAVHTAGNTAKEDGM